MSDPIWNYVDQTNIAVWREWPDGRQESCLVSTPEVQAWLAEGNTPNPYVPPPPPVPQFISDRQFFQQAAITGLITQDEALAAVQTGTVPAVLMTVINGLSDEMQQFAAKMIISGATQFDRNNPLTLSVGAALGWTSEQIDAFFIAAAAL